MTPRAFPKLYCAAGYEIDTTRGMFFIDDGIRVYHVTNKTPDYRMALVEHAENFSHVAIYQRAEYRIPKGAWEIAFEVDE